MLPLTSGRRARSREGRRIEVSGTVQGVGFRPWVYRTAVEGAITGRVCNHSSGVTIEAFGEPEAIDRFVERLTTAGPPAAAIRSVSFEPIPYEPAVGFQIVSSRKRDEVRVAIPPDLATCPECLQEVCDPADRRYGYPFTNCTSCGPRFTIATAAPYDRPNTTMDRFPMCPACAAEYESVQDRRFHAQPNACPVCGPQLRAVTPSGTPVTGDPLRVAVRALEAGCIVAIKGLGGFHLACDATSAAAIDRLRQRKRRDEKPFAVMARDLEHAQALAVLTVDEGRLLASSARPIVLVPRREQSCLAPAVAPGNPWVGLFLPYAPLHHLLLGLVRRPLVMTSGNLSEEPIAIGNEEALERLRAIADLFLLHDREIVTRCDDSVVRVTNGRPVMLRRSRGYVPAPVGLPRSVSKPVLACGALLKNTFCIARDRDAVLGPHIGDLENLETFTAYQESIDRMERFLDVRPAVIAHDLHPEYLSTQYARRRRGVIAVPVQHHHAHVAAVMAEHGLVGPVIGVAYDGTGLGTDGTAWGGEILVADFAGFTRVATFRPLALAGGDTAIRQPWRLALALVEDAFDGDAPVEALPLFTEIDKADLHVVRTMIRLGLNAPRAHGAGRYFDAFGALGLGRSRASYEGQVALEWNAIADPQERSRYRYEIVRGSSPWELDLRPAAREALFELIGGEAPARVSARFHNTVIGATADLVRGVVRARGRMPVVLGGGCFQNDMLAAGVVRELTPEHTVYLPSQVPPGDGGIALGQALVADAVVRAQ
ncbi:MAG TPA: carbamoyltransferase HypF [Vicinamibacterales bacterium]|nr:carbamoyltransferase HypF [Vicinamibacterales bacterium]